MAHSFPPSLSRGGIHLPPAPPSLTDAVKYSYTILRTQAAGMHTTNILLALALSPEVGSWKGCPVGLLLLQAAEDIDFSGSSPSSSPLVVSMAEDTSLDWWYTLLFTWKCSFLLEMLVASSSFLWTKEWFDLLQLRGFQQQLTFYRSVWELDNHSSVALDPNCHHLMHSSHIEVGLCGFCANSG